MNRASSNPTTRCRTSHRHGEGVVPIHVVHANSSSMSLEMTHVVPDAKQNELNRHHRLRLQSITHGYFFAVARPFLPLRILPYCTAKRRSLVHFWQFHQGKPIVFYLLHRLDKLFHIDRLGDVTTGTQLVRSRDITFDIRGGEHNDGNTV